jgi:GAF domain-containing protein
VSASPRSRACTLRVVNKTPGSWRRWAEGAGFAAALLAIAYFLQTVGQADDWKPWVSWKPWVGALLTFVALSVPTALALRERLKAEKLAKVAEDARRAATRPAHIGFDIISRISDAIEDVVDAADADDRLLKKERLKQLAVILLLRLGPNTRACFFQYSIETLPLGRQSRVLRSTADSGGLWHGTEERRKPPRKEFRDDEFSDIAGIERFRMLDERTIVFVEDVSTNPPPGWPNDRDYKAFIAAPVATESKLFGLLGLDSSEPGDLSMADVEVVRLVAQVLAVGLSIE